MENFCAEFDFGRKSFRVIEGAETRSTQGSGLVLVGDLRVDNRAELRAALSLRDTFDDRLLVLAAYEKWGEACAEKIIGDFAFAVIDVSQNRVFCARDVFGVKPFYYHFESGRLLLASRLKSLLSQGLPRELDPAKLADHLLWTFESPEATFFKSIRRLPAAFYLAAEPSGARSKRFWSLDNSSKTTLASDREYAMRFKELFTEAVRCRLPDWPQAGTLLSGGLDSSAVTAVSASLAAEEGGSVQAFSAVFDEVPSSDEQHYIDAVLSLEGLRGKKVAADGLSPFLEFERSEGHLDEPHNYEIAMFLGGIYPQARQAGIQVLLDGDGGDEVVFRGYLRLAELLRERKFSEYFKTLGALARNLGRPPADLLVSQSLRPLAPPFLLRAWRSLRWGNRALWFDRHLFNPDFARSIDLASREEKQIRLEMTPPRTVKEDHLRQLSSPSVSYAFEIMQQAAAPFGIEHRYPFHDRRLVEFCLSLPSDQKMKDGWTRVVMRRALKDVLPDLVRWRGGKTYLSDDLVYRLNHYGRETLRSEILRDPSRLRPFYNMKNLEHCLKLFLASPRYPTAIIVWQAAALSLWLKRECH